ncbi:hypothetical protein WJX74_006111 [Apatococcus lobatus]|uniref:Uncharacterized protein n=1 Tax=Apatococcus lobatus TaxID=904363 RepID=A0AAW1QMN0_9CHLO
MPLDTPYVALLGVGLCSLGAAVHFYKTKQTNYFKAAYFCTWPTLGSGLVLVMEPRREKMIKDMERRGTFDQEQMTEARKNTAMQMEMMREAAHSKKPAHLLDR